MTFLQTGHRTDWTGPHRLDRLDRLDLLDSLDLMDRRNRLHTWTDRADRTGGQVKGSFHNNCDILSLFRKKKQFIPNFPNVCTLFV